jgi:hypothetical protein
MAKRFVLFVLLAATVCLAAVPSAEAAVFFRGGYRYGGYRYGGDRYGRGVGYNPYTSRYGAYRYAYNPYTNRYGAYRYAYNPSTGRYEYQYAYRD